MDTSQILSQDRGRVQGIQKQGIAHNTPQVSYGGFDKASALLLNHVKNKRKEEAKEAEENKVNDRLKGELLEQSGKTLEGVENPTQRLAYNASKYRRDTSNVSSELYKILGTEDFQSLSEDARASAIQDTKDTLIDSMASYEGISSDEATNKYVVAKLREIDIQAQKATYMYQNVTLPTKTIGIEADNLIKSNADKATWDKGLALFENLKGGLDDKEFNSVLYGTVTRALDMGQLDAYSSLEGSKHFNNMTTEQQRTLDNAYIRAVGRVEKQQVDNLIAQGREIAGQLSTGASLDNLKEYYTNLSKLPPHIRNAVSDKVETKMDKGIKIANSMRLVDVAKQAPLAVNVQQDDIDTAFEVERKIAFEQSKADNGNNAYPTSPQASNQTLALKYAKSGMFPKDVQNDFNLLSGGVQNNELNPRTKQAMLGAETAVKAGFSETQMRNLMGDKSYELFDKIRVYRSQGMDSVTSYTLATEDLDKHKSKSLFEKGKGIVDKLDAINRAGFLDKLDDIASIIPDFANKAGGLRTFFSDEKLEDRLRDDHELYTKSSGSNVYSKEVNNAISASNKANLMNLAVGYVGSKGLMSEVDTAKAFEERVEKEALIVNNNIVLDSNLFTKYTRLTGDTKQASKYMSKSFQVIAQMQGMSPEAKIGIYSKFIDIVGKDGKVIDSISDGRKLQLMEQGSTDAYRVRVNLDNLATAFDGDRDLKVQGSTLEEVIQDRKRIDDLPKSLSEKSEDVLGRSGSGRSRDVFTPHTVRYIPDTNSYMVIPLNNDGEPITEGDGDTLETAPLFMSTVSDNIVEAFVRAYAEKEQEDGLLENSLDWASDRVNKAVNAVKQYRR